MNRAFHTPSSKSCMRSTTSIRYGLKPNGLSFRENAFCALMSASSPVCGLCHTYNGGRPGLCLQYVFHCFAIDDVVSVVDKIPSQVNFTPPRFIVYSSKSFTL